MNQHEHSSVGAALDVSQLPNQKYLIRIFGLGHKEYAICLDAILDFLFLFFNVHVKGIPTRVSKLTKTLQRMEFKDVVIRPH